MKKYAKYAPLIVIMMAVTFPAQAHRGSAQFQNRTKMPGSTTVKIKNGQNPSLICQRAHFSNRKKLTKKAKNHCLIVHGNGVPLGIRGSVPYSRGRCTINSNSSLTRKRKGSSRTGRSLVKTLSARGTIIFRCW